MRGESFEQAQARGAKQAEIGRALGTARFERGERLTADERQALAHWSRWGSDGYPIHKLGRGWAIEHKARGLQGFKTKREAWCAWEVFVDILLTMSGLEARERERGAA